MWQHDSEEHEYGSGVVSIPRLCCDDDFIGNNINRGPQRSYKYIYVRQCLYRLCLHAVVPAEEELVHNQPAPVGGKHKQAWHTPQPP